MGTTESLHRPQDTLGSRVSRRAPSHTKINWFDGKLAEARRASADAKRPLLVYLYTSWCGPCKQLDKTTFRDLKVIRELERTVISFKLDGDTRMGQRFRAKYRITSYPTFIMFSPGGSEIDRGFGFRNTRSLLTFVSNMIQDRNTVGDYHRRLVLEPGNLRLRSRLGFQLALRGDVDKARHHLRKVVELDPKNDTQLASQALFVLARYVYQMKSQNLKKACDVYEELVQSYPASSTAASCAIRAAQLLIRTKQQDRALNLLKHLLRAQRKNGRLYLAAAVWVGRFPTHKKVAMGWVRRACKLLTHGHPWWVLSRFYANSGEQKKSIKALTEAVRRSPKHRGYRRALDRAQGR